jgi:hypothetical protein
VKNVKEYIPEGIRSSAIEGYQKYIESCDESKMKSWGMLSREITFAREYLATLSVSPLNSTQTAPVGVLENGDNPVEHGKAEHGDIRWSRRAKR